MVLMRKLPTTSGSVVTRETASRGGDWRTKDSGRWTSRRHTRRRRFRLMISSMISVRSPVMDPRSQPTRIAVTSSPTVDAETSPAKIAAVYWD